MIDRVESVLREVAAETVMPRFRNLADHDVQEKGPGDLVTIVDREVEAALTIKLTDLLHGSLVVGEEAVAADHRVLERVGDPGPVWLIDPIDGTGNFAAGKEPFALMVALMRGGFPVLAVIYEPVTGSMAAAEAGSGAYLDGKPVSVDDTPVGGPHEVTGALALTYLPDTVRQKVVVGSARLREVTGPQHCAGREYPDIVRGNRDFALFWRSLPWDHVPGALFLREAGGVVRHFDGADYDPLVPKQGLLACRNEEVFRIAKAALLE